MSETPNFEIPEVAAAQAQKHVTINHAFRVIDTAMNLNIINTTTTAPPGSPSEGDKYIPLATATGTWTGKENQIASYINAAWIFFVPAEGWRCYNQATNEVLIFNGSTWTDYVDSLTFDILGVNATADTTNRLSVNSDAVLFNHAGSDSQVKVNKNAVGDDAGFVFQTGFSTRALFGLLANDDFTVKVSPDGSAFTTAMVIDKDNGNIGFGTATPTEALQVLKPGNSVKITIEDSNNPRDNYIECTVADNLTIAADESDTGTNSSIRFRVDAAEAMRITDSGALGVGTNNPTHKFNVVTADVEAAGRFDADHATYTHTVVQVNANRTGASAYSLLRMYSGDYVDTQFNFTGDGNGTCDGAWTGGGADRAEALEWLDGNPTNEDRTGWAVVIDSGKIRRATEGEIPIGIVSATYDSIGNAAPLKWGKKYLVDDLGRKLFEAYSVTEWTEVTETGEIKHSYQSDKIPQELTVLESAIVITADDDGEALQRRVLNPKYDPSTDYTPRLDRPEWDAVGLLGVIRVLKGEQVNPNWIKLSDISATVEEWLVR